MASGRSAMWSRASTTTAKSSCARSSQACRTVATSERNWSGSCATSRPESLVFREIAETPGDLLNRPIPRREAGDRRARGRPSRGPERRPKSRRPSRCSVTQGGRLGGPEEPGEPDRAPPDKARADCEANRPVYHAYLLKGQLRAVFQIRWPMLAPTLAPPRLAVDRRRA